MKPALAPVLRFYWATIAAILAGAPVAHAQEWTRFRGPNGSGVSASRFPAAWTEADYLWKIDLPGVGHSSPVLWGERLFLTSGNEASGQRSLLAYDAPTGRRLWQQDYPAVKNGKHDLNSLASPTPTVDAERVYHCFATTEQFLVVAVSHDGRELWRQDLGTYPAGHGYGASPILAEGLLIVPNEQPENGRLLALDATTGAIRWQTPRENPAHYYTPCLLERNGQTDLIATNWERGIAGLDPRTGATRWAADVFDKSHIECSIGSPIVARDLVLGVCGWLGHGNEAIAVRPPDSPQATATQMYRLDRGAPLCTTPLVKGNLLFLWTDSGVATCAEAATGKVHWTKRVGGTYYSSPVAAGDYVYNISTDGEVVALAASPEFEVAARNRLDEGSHATTAVAGGVLYVRTFSHLYAIRGRRE